MSRFVFTGGHHNSALVVAQELTKLGHLVYWYGHRHSSRIDQNDSAEYLEVIASKIPFFDLPAGRVSSSLLELLRLPLGVISALRLLSRHHPIAVVTFGGYLGAATCFAALLRGVPIYLHEQTVNIGKANQLLAHFARKIYLTWPQSLNYVPSSRASVVGLPLRQSLLDSSRKVLFARHKPTLLVMGGKQGAHVINQFIFHNLKELMMEYNIVHQTGTNSSTQDYETAISLQNSLGSLQDCYLPLGYITEAQIGTYLRSADVYLGRSGAHICYELLYTSLRSVLIPLPGSHRSEQHGNASILVAQALAITLSQSSLSLPSLRQALRTAKALHPTPEPLPLDATQKIVHDLTTI